VVIKPHLIASMRLACLASLLVTCLHAGAQTPLGKINGPAEVFALEGDFEDVRDSLVFAIESQGLVISYISHAADMLERTGAVVDHPPAVYGGAEVVLFCKAGLSHNLAADNPHNLVLCPYPIAVYSLTDEPDTTYLSIPAYPDAPVYRELRAFLLGIIARAKEGVF